MQFINDEHIFIKYAGSDQLAGNYAEPDFVCFFVIYALNTTEVLGIFENNSSVLFDYLQQNNLNLFNPARLNDCYAQEAFNRQVSFIEKAKNGGKTQAIKKVLSVLPEAPQFHSQSVYYDTSIFSYDERVIQPSER